MEVSFVLNVVEGFKMKKFLIKVHNELFPVNYNLWKKEQDKVFYGIKKNLRKDWLSSQISIHSSMNLPLLLFLITIMILYCIEIFELSKNYLFKFFPFVLAIIVVSYLILLNGKYNKYVNEKYKEEEL